MSENANLDYRIEHIDPLDSRWMRFISGNTNATIFHHPKWLSVLSECYGFRPFIAVALGASGDVVAGIPFMEIVGILKKKSWTSLPFTDHCLPLAKDDRALEITARYIIRQAKERGISRVDFRWDTPGVSAGQAYSKFVLTKLNLSTDSSDIQRRIKPKHFRQIEVAQRRGVEVRWGKRQEDLSAFYELHSQTRRRLGVPVQPRVFFEKVFRSICQTGNGFFLLASKGRKDIAAALFLNWNKTLVYKYSASTRDAARFYAIDPIIWTAIDWGCREGLLWMDFGRTEIGNQGLRNFKRRWGAEEKPLVYLGFPQAPHESLRDKLFPLLNSVLKRTPIWVCQLTGRILYRYFG